MEVTFRRLFLEHVVNAECSVTIFSVVETAGHEDRGTYVFKVQARVSVQPELVVVGVLHHVAPKSQAVAEECGNLRHRLVQEIIIDVAFDFHKVRESLCRRFPELPVESASESVTVCKTKRSVMVSIVSHEPVSSRGLRTGSLDGRVTGQHGHHCVKSWIRVSLHTYFTGILCVFKKPLDSIVSICRFVCYNRTVLSFQCICGAAGTREIRTHVLVLAVTQIFTLNVLQDNHISLGNIVRHVTFQVTSEAFRFGRAEVLSGLKPVWLKGIRSPQHHYRTRITSKFQKIFPLGLIYGVVDFPAVTDSHHDLALGVILFEPSVINDLPMLGGHRQNAA